MSATDNPERELFNAALEQPTEERAAFLRGACHGNEELRRRVEELLQAFDGSSKILADEISTVHQGAPLTEGPGTIIGRYKLLQKIGEGGMGVVYMAEQEEPVRRRVALKIIKLGMDTRQVVARFEAERQALALMDHPNIANVLDAGATDTPVAAGILPAVEPGVPPGGKRVGAPRRGEDSAEAIQSQQFILRALVCWATAALIFASGLRAQESSADSRLEGFDDYMEKLLKDWNAPAVGVGVVVRDKLVFAKGYGYRDYEKKLPFTPKTLCPIASNTKLFTAVAAGLLVKEGKLEWDKPVRDFVPSIRFYNDELNRSVTLRDMLAHRTGITRHDMIWYKSEFTRKELYDRLEYLEPKEPLRQLFLYNNLMYAAAGYIIELQSGKTWEEYVRERILIPLAMNSSVYSIAQMTNAPDFGVPFTEKRDSTEIHRIPYYEDIAGLAPGGALISSIEDVSHWLIALMNEGNYLGKQVLPAEVLKATMEPAIALANVQGEARGFWELLNAAYGMGRQTASYRGHLLTYHGGALPGFFSQVSFMPQDHIGVIALVIGEHCASLNNIVSYHLYERLLGMDETPWSARLLEIQKKGKQAGTAARAKAGAGRVSDSKPSHPLEAYVGEYENAAYGLLKIGIKEGQLQFDFHKIRLPLSHFHYDRFDTPDDEIDGKWSVNFATNPQGDLERATMSLDEAEATFIRRPETLERKVLQQLAGTYETPTGFKFQVILRENGSLCAAFPGQPEMKFVPYKGLKFHVKEFSDLTFEFLMDTGRVGALKQVDPSGEYVHKRKE